MASLEGLNPVILPGPTPSGLKDPVILPGPTPSGLKDPVILPGPTPSGLKDPVILPGTVTSPNEVPTLKYVIQRKTNAVKNKTSLTLIRHKFKGNTFRIFNFRLK
jgi:hypothetical protein